MSESHVSSSLAASSHASRFSGFTRAKQAPALEPCSDGQTAERMSECVIAC